MRGYLLGYFLNTLQREVCSCRLSTVVRAFIAAWWQKTLSCIQAPAGTQSIRQFIKIICVASFGLIAGAESALSLIFVSPTVTELSPSSGVIVGGTSVVITGTHFTGAASVNFGATPATNVTVLSATMMTATAPAGSSGPVNVTITTQFGTSATGASNQFTYYTSPDAPVIGTATAGDTTATVAFTAPASTGGSAITLYTVTSSPSNITATGTTSPITITGLLNGTAYTFTVTATNIAGTGQASGTSNTVTPALTATPATEFAALSDAIHQTLTDDATLALNAALSANQSMVQDAKERFAALGVFVRSSVQPVVRSVYAKRRSDGSLTANPVSVSSMGTFFGQSTHGNGTRQVVFGTFDLQRDDATGASTATFNGKIAWEREISNSTLLGYFIGGDLARSNIAGSFTGDQDHLGITAGGYAVHEMAKQLYLDGFVSVGAGRNNLTMDDGVLALESDYTTRSATFGMSVSGVIGPQGYEIWPELALTVGRTWIDTVAFTGTAYDATDNTLSLDAGMVTLANLTFRPEFRVPLDGSEVSKSLRLITLAPRLICQQTTTTTTAQTCGGGAEIGLQTHSADGTTTASAQILSDWIDGQTRTSGQLSVEMRF